jgi:hypothetical protein
VTLTPVPRRPPRLLEGLPPAKSTTPRTAGNSWLKTYNAPKSRWSDLADREPNDEIIFQVIGRRTSELDSGHKTLFTVITLCRGNPSHSALAWQVEQGLPKRAEPADL